MVEVEESFTRVQFRDAFYQKWSLKRGRRINSPILLYRDTLGVHFFWEDERGDRHFGLLNDVSFYFASGGTAGGLPVTRTTTPGALDNGLVVRNIPSGTQPVSGTVTANQGTGWRDTAGGAAGNPLTVGGIDANGLAQTLPIDSANQA